jgi:hypothetical protein
MASTAKAVAMRRALADLLRQRGYTVTESFSTVDSDGNPAPTIQVGAGTAGTASCFIKLKPVAAWGKDALGLTQNVFTPHIIQMVQENVSGAGAYPLTFAKFAEIWGVLTQQGTRAELYTRANGTAAAETDITTGNLTLAFQPHLNYPLMSDQ